LPAPALAALFSEGALTTSRVKLDDSLVKPSSRVELEDTSVGLRVKLEDALVGLRELEDTSVVPRVKFLAAIQMYSSFLHVFYYAQP